MPRRQKPIDARSQKLLKTSTMNSNIQKNEKFKKQKNK